MCAITSWTRQPSQSLAIAHSSALRLFATFSTSSRSRNASALARYDVRGLLRPLGSGSMRRTHVQLGQSVQRRASPCLALGCRSGLADVEPPGDVDLHEVELEQRIVRHRLDHAADLARRADGDDGGSLARRRR